MGGKRPLTVEDLGTIGHDYKAATLYEHYSVEWEKEQQRAKAKGKKPSFIMAIVRTTGLWYWTVAILLNLLVCCISFVPTIILNLLVKDFESDEPSPLFISCVMRRLHDALGVCRALADCTHYCGCAQLHHPNDDH